jgi:hypothetical protein
MDFLGVLINGLGKTGDSVSVFPARARSFEAKNRPYIEFEIDIEKSGDFECAVLLDPNSTARTRRGLRIAFSTDDGTPQTVVNR